MTKKKPRKPMTVQAAQHQLENGDAGKNGLTNYAHALWGAGYIPVDPAFAEHATEMLSRLHARIGLLNDRIDGLELQLEQPAPPNELAMTCPPAGIIDGQTLKQVCQQVAKKHNVTQCALKSEQREQVVVRARQEAFYESARLGKSTTQIGNFYNRDHTTVLHGIKRHKKLITTNPECIIKAVVK